MSQRGNKPSDFAPGDTVLGVVSSIETDATRILRIVNDLFAEEERRSGPYPEAQCPHGVKIIGGQKVCLGCNALRAERTRRATRIVELEKVRETLLTYCQVKFDQGDMHGVQDAASDLRDLDNELDGLRY